MSDLEADDAPTEEVPVVPAAGAVPPASTGASPEGPARRRFSVGGPFAAYEWAVLGAICLAYLMVVVLAVRRGPPLGWDESVYTLRARDFASGAEAGNYWSTYRAPGLPWLGHFLWDAGNQATVLRLVVAAFGLGLMGVVWLLTRHLFGRGAALVAAGGVALTPPLLLAATQVWPDVPGAAVGLLAIALFVFATGSDRPSWWMLTLAPAAGAATYLRFGSPLPMAVGLLGVAVWRRRMLLARWWVPAVTAAAATAAVVLVLLLPGSTGASGSPFGAISGSPRTLGEGFVDYATLAQDVVAPAAVILALAGVVASVGWALRGEVARGPLTAAAAVGLVTAVAIGLVLHGEVRYLAPFYPWLWIVAAPGLERLGRSLPGKARPVVAVLVALLLTLAVAGMARDRNRDQSRALSPVREASQAIAVYAGGGPCLVVTRRLPHVEWYSGCDAVLFDTREATLPEPEEGPVFMLFQEGDPKEPQGALREAYLAAVGEPWLVEGGQRAVTVYLVGEAAAGG